MKEIKLHPTSKGNVAIVDDADYEELNKCWWRMSNRGYVVMCGRNNKHIFMHHVILGVNNTGLVCDHVNKVRHDNRRENLRYVTNAQNNQNHARQKTSRFLGVYWARDREKWRVEIAQNGVAHLLGQFSDEVEAARCYDNKARELFGSSATLNFPNA